MTLAEIISEPPKQNRIYKYPISILAPGTFSIPITGGRLERILDFQEQAGHLVVWAVIDTAQLGYQGSIDIKVCWTGDPEPDPNQYFYWRTIQGSDGLVYHIYVHDDYL